MRDRCWSSPKKRRCDRHRRLRERGRAAEPTAARHHCVLCDKQQNARINYIGIDSSSTSYSGFAPIIIIIWFFHVVPYPYISTSGLRYNAPGTTTQNNTNYDVCCLYKSAYLPISRFFSIPDGCAYSSGSRSISPFRRRRNFLSRMAFLFAILARNWSGAVTMRTLVHRFRQRLVT